MSSLSSVLYTFVSIESVTNRCLAFFIFLYRLSIPLRDEIAASYSWARMSTTTFPGQAHLVQVVYVWKMRRVSGVNSNQRSHAAPGSWWQATLGTARVHTIRLSTIFHKRKFSIKNVLSHLAKQMFKHSREIMMGEGNRVASVILFTFTLKLGLHAHTACVKPPPTCWHSLS